MMASRSASMASVSSNILVDMYDPVAPLVHLTVSKSAYRPGETVSAIIDVENSRGLGEDQTAEVQGRGERSISQHHISPDIGADTVVIDDLSVELKGFERLDQSWVQLPKTHPGGGRANSGERVFLEGSGQSILKDVHVESGGSRSYSIRITLPKVLPPSYRGTCVKYHYYLGVRVVWSSALKAQSNADLEHPSALQSPPPLEVKVPLRIWTLPQSSGLTQEEIGAEHHHGPGGIVPVDLLKVEVRWRERQSRSRWVVKAQNSSRADEEEFLQPEESSYSESESMGDVTAERAASFSGLRLSSPSAGATVATATISEVDDLDANVLSERNFGNAEVEGNLGGGESDREGSNSVRGEGSFFGQGRESFAMEGVGDRLGEGTPLRGPGLGTLKLNNGRGDYIYRDFDDLALDNSWKSSLSEPATPNAQTHTEYFANGNNLLLQQNEDAIPPSPSDFVITRGRTYNIRIDDQILVKFTPRRPETTYYLGDVVAGMLTFPSTRGSRECLAVSVLLETQELVNPAVLHSSRRTGTRDQLSGPVYVPQIQTEFHEVTAHLQATHFIFTIPMDAPAAFATPLVSLQWVLRFEFVSSAKKRKDSGGNNREEVERGEWSMPLVVHAPLPHPHTFGLASSAVPTATVRSQSANPTADRVRRLVAASQRSSDSTSTNSYTAADSLIGTFGKAFGSRSKLSSDAQSAPKTAADQSSP